MTSYQHNHRQNEDGSIQHLPKCSSELRSPPPSLKIAKPNANDTASGSGSVIIHAAVNDEDIGSSTPSVKSRSRRSKAEASVSNKRKPKKQPIRDVTPPAVPLVTPGPRNPLIKEEDLVEVKLGDVSKPQHVYFTKSEDGRLDICNLDQFGLGPEIQVPVARHRGFTRKVISDVS